MAKTSSSKVPAGPSTRKQYLKKRATKYWFCERTNLIQPVEAEAFPRFLRWNLPSLNKEMSGDFHNKVSALQGETGKMLDSDPNFAIYVTESGKDIKNKINKYAFSDRQDSIENHRKYGANLEVDIPIKYLCFFLENDAELEHIHTEYGAGHMLTGEVKKRLIEVLMDLVERHHRARAAVTDEATSYLVNASIRKIKVNFGPQPRY